MQVSLDVSSALIWCLKTRWKLCAESSGQHLVLKVPSIAALNQFEQLKGSGKEGH